MLKSMKKFFRVKKVNKKDPIEIFHPSIVELVFQHLNGSELLQCTLVNSSWNETVSNSKEWTRKVGLSICETNYDHHQIYSDDLVIMMKNRRRYESVMLMIHRKMTSNHLLLIASLKQLKSLFLMNHTFSSEIELTNFLGIIEPFIEHLELSHINIASSKRNRISRLNYKFSNLKTLKVKMSTSYLLSEVFIKTEYLVHLEIKTGHSDDIDSLDKAKSIQKILVRNDYINNLTLHLDQKDFDNLFDDKSSRILSQVRCQLHFLSLRKFRIILDSSGMVNNSEQLINLLSFMTSQKRYLRHLELLSWTGNVILENVMNILNLSSLVIGEAHCYGKDQHIAGMNILQNETIESLSIYSTETRNELLQSKILKSLPFLKHLCIDEISQSTLDIMIKFNEKLETLKVDQFKAYYPPERAVLLSMKSMTIRQEYARTFKALLRDFKNYTNFELVFLRAAIKTDESMIK